MKTRQLLLVCAALLLAGVAAAQTHPSQQPPLTKDTVFPRCTPEQLADGGFPDHLHAYWWPDWEVMTDSDGQTYGPGAFCERKKVVPRPGLVVAEGEKAFGHFVVRHNPSYRDCDMLPLLEILTWAGRVNEDLLGLTSADTLVVISPDNIPAYREQTGQDVWRLYQLKGDSCIIEPYGTLQARTLDGHAGFMVVTDWLLHENVGNRLPVWLHQGLVEYMSEDGVHLVNYMVQFRDNENLILAPPLIETILTKGVDPDPARDRELYRRACYSAFLMVWRLVEDEGGLSAMCQFLDRLKDGQEVDQAAVQVYGRTMAELALSLNPAKLDEPIGTATQSRKPQFQP